MLRAALMLLMLTATGCVLTDGVRRSSLPIEVREARLIDASPVKSTYEPIDPQMILALRNSLRKSCELKQVEHGEKHLPLNVLAISGGGAYGAFDAGVLQGWSESGSRPTFDVVTGVSTGALIATYAFLGPEYDAYVRDAYVNSRAEDIFKTLPLITLIRSDSLASSRPLKKRIDDAITPELLKKVAGEHSKGRRLYVGTTNLDTRRFVIWDMGAIAAGGQPESVALYRKIILASSSVPGFLPPVLIDVEVDGKKYQELHVDGGTTAAVFVPMSLAKCDPRKLARRPGSCVYVISSGKLYADTETVKRQFAHITLDAITAMLYAGSRNDIFRIFNMALLCGMDFQLIAVPQEFPLNQDSFAFDPAELKRLFQLGYEMGKTRQGWRQTPPGAEVTEQTLPRTSVQFKTEK